MPLNSEPHGGHGEEIVRALLLRSGFKMREGEFVAVLRVLAFHTVNGRLMEAFHPCNIAEALSQLRCLGRDDHVCSAVCEITLLTPTHAGEANCARVATAYPTLRSTRIGHEWPARK